MRSRIRYDVPKLMETLGIRIKRSGRRLWAKCPHPDHVERTPSWFIWDDPHHGWHGHHKCYGCGYGGWPTHLVQTHLTMDWEQAVEWLAKHVAGEVPELPAQLEIDIREHIAPIEMPAEVCFEDFKNWPSPPRNYLLERNVTVAQVERWGIGYAVGGALAGRIVIPVRTTAGVLAGYTGRSFTNSNRLRYKNATAADGAQLGVLHGEHLWGPERSLIVVTEGTFDGLAIERAVPGVTIGAIWGSQFLPAHAAKLARFGWVVVATDPDPAGDAAYETIRTTLARYTTVVRMHIPEGRDAGDMQPHELLTSFQASLHG